MYTLTVKSKPKAKQRVRNPVTSILEDLVHLVLHHELDKLGVLFPYDNATRICVKLRSVVSYRKVPYTKKEKGMTQPKKEELQNFEHTRHSELDDIMLDVCAKPDCKELEDHAVLKAVVYGRLKKWHEKELKAHTTSLKEAVEKKRWNCKKIERPYCDQRPPCEFEMGHSQALDDILSLLTDSE